MEWNGRKIRPVGNLVKPKEFDFNDALKPLGEKRNNGFVWVPTKQIIMDVDQEDSTPVSPTPTPTITSTPTVTPTTSVTPTVTTTPTNTPTTSVTPSITPTTTVTPTVTTTPTISLTPTNTQTPTISLSPTNTPTISVTPTITPSPSQAPSGTTEANTYLSAVVSAGGTGITSTVSAATRTLFTELVSNGLYSKMTAMYPMLGGVSASAKFNALNPVDTDGAYRLTFNGGWTFNASGATPNGSNGYAKTYLTGNTLNRYSQHISFYSSTQQTANIIDMGCRSGSGGAGTYSELVICQSAFGGNFRSFNNNSVGLGNNTTANTGATGYFVSSRETDTKSYLYKNGSLDQSGTTTTNGTIPFDFFIGATNDNGNPLSYSSRRCSFVSIGGGLTPSEITTLSTIINTWATTIGRNTY